MSYFKASYVRIYNHTENKVWWKKFIFKSVCIDETRLNLPLLHLPSLQTDISSDEQFRTVQWVYKNLSECGVNRGPPIGDGENLNSERSCNYLLKCARCVLYIEYQIEDNISIDLIETNHTGCCHIILLTSRDELPSRLIKWAYENLNKSEIKYSLVSVTRFKSERCRKCITITVWAYIEEEVQEKIRLIFITWNITWILSALYCHLFFLLACSL